METPLSQGQLDMLETLTNHQKTLGNELFKRKQYGEAAVTYSSGLSISPKNINLLSNRSACYLNMSLYSKALQDSENVLEQNPSHEKCLFRKIKSLWGLKKYKEAVDFIQTQIPLEILEKSQDLKSLQEKSHKILKQSEGNIQIIDLMQLPKEQRNDFGEFQGPVKTAPVPSKGRGLLATEDIPKGQVILCSKAFCILFNEDLKAFKEAMKDSADVSNWTSEECCEALICNNLTLEPSIREEFFDLYSGPQEIPCTFNHQALDNQEPSSLQNELHLIKSIVNYNGFGSKQHINPMGKEGSVDFFGLWITPSYLNHSCIDSNAFYSTFGDIMIVRSLKEIKKDEEITITYLSPKTQDRMEKIQRLYQFECTCRACEMERNEPVWISQEIKTTLDLIRKGVDGLDLVQNLSTQLSRIETIISLREENGYAKTNFDLLDYSIEITCSKLKETKGWEKKGLEIMEKMHDIVVNNCFVMRSLYLSVSIFKKYWGLEEMDSVIKWWKNVKMNSTAAFGSTDGLMGLRLLSEREILELNELEIAKDLQKIDIS